MIIEKVEISVIDDAGRPLGAVIGGVNFIRADQFEYLRAQLASARKALVGMAADCHRSKWQFDLSDDYKPTAAASRALILKAFDELHRIGNVGIAAYSAKDIPNV